LTSQEKLRRFEEQISPHLKSAYNLAKWLTRSHEDAEDVVQEAFLRAFSAFESFRGEDANPQSSKAWLLTIVRNTTMTWLKRNRNAGAMLGFEEALDDPRDHSADPEEILLISCDRDEVRQSCCERWKASRTERFRQPSGFPSARLCRGCLEAAIG
jgi:RNA polymerase sigma factor (sigma-70 family)